MNDRNDESSWTDPFVISALAIAVLLLIYAIKLYPHGVDAATRLAHHG
jgi:hypothetical protein